MANIFGELNLNDTDRVFNATAGQEVIYDFINDYVARYNMTMQQAMGAFVSMNTENYKERFKLPANGRLQRRGRRSLPAARKNAGSWDVAYPLNDFGDVVAGDDVTIAYMTATELTSHINGTIQRNSGTVRHEILYSLFNNTQRPFIDPLWGTLNVEPLANGDAVLYPPVLGSDTEATDDHYLVSGYTSANISDTNDPYPVIADELVEHFGEQVGGSNIVTFINPDEASKTKDLTDFTEVPDQYIRTGDDTDVPEGLPSVPGKIIGRMSDSTWVSQWRWIPSGYMLSVHLEVEAPLIQRVDPSDTGLGQGLVLVANDFNAPVESWFWRNRFGLGARNRLNGVVMQLSAPGAYVIPTAYQ